MYSIVQFITRRYYVLESSVSIASDYNNNNAMERECRQFKLTCCLAFMALKKSIIKVPQKGNLGTSKCLKSRNDKVLF